MKDKIGETHEGVITGITDWGIFVELKENKCEGLVKLSSIKDDMYDYDENNMCLVGRYYFRKLSLGDSVKVKIKDANPLSRTIDFSWIDGGNRIVPQNKPFKHKKRK
jgi:ribonuclease R